MVGILWSQLGSSEWSGSCRIMLRFEPVLEDGSLNDAVRLREVDGPTEAERVPSAASSHSSKVGPDAQSP